MIRFWKVWIMKTENCAEMTGAQRIELKSGLAEPGKHHRNCGFLIPAGVLIGLGMGILADYVFTGFLIGLGFGLLGEGLLPLVKKPLEGECPRPEGANGTMLLIGAFLILIGISIVLAPAAIWPYVFAGFFILAGIWVLVRGLARIS